MSFYWNIVCYKAEICMPVSAQSLHLIYILYVTMLKFVNLTISNAFSNVVFQEKTVAQNLYRGLGDFLCKIQTKQHHLFPHALATFDAIVCPSYFFSLWVGVGSGLGQLQKKNKITLNPQSESSILFDLLFAAKN